MGNGADVAAGRRGHLVFKSADARVAKHWFQAGWVILVIGAAGQLVNCATGSVGYLLLYVRKPEEAGQSSNDYGRCHRYLVPALCASMGYRGSGRCRRDRERRFKCVVSFRSQDAFEAVSLQSQLLDPWRACRGGFSRSGRPQSRVAISPGRHPSISVQHGFRKLYVIFVGTVLLLGLDADDRRIPNAIWSRICNWFPGIAENAS